MRVISINVNGIRSAAKKGFFEWLAKQDADVICFQETRAEQAQLNDKIFFPKNYNTYFFSAAKKGYSGVAIYCKTEPDEINTGLGWQTADEEGRYIEVKFGKITVASLYLPSGTSGDERQNIKYDFLDKYLKMLKAQIKSNQEYIICGDWNIAHTKNDIKNWRSNQKNSGFLPEERAWLDNLFDNIGYVDAYRYFNPDKIEYTWWSNRGKAWENNTGWRIDYQIITPGIADKIVNTRIYRESKFSDHAPLIIDYEL